VFTHQRSLAGVSTAILVFTRGGKTDHVFFYDVGADGFSLDDKRDSITENDLPDALERWRKRNAKKDTDRTAKHFMVPVADIEAKDFDLSINRYKDLAIIYFGGSYSTASCFSTAWRTADSPSDAFGG
jgi:hypothetical protein